MSDFVENARKFALEAHGIHPYEYHLSGVVEILSEHGHDNPYNLALAWLHDVIEDTKVTREQIENVYERTPRFCESVIHPK